MLLENWLLQNILVGFPTKILNSLSTLFSHIPSHMPCVMALNLDSVLRFDRTNYFLLHHVAKFPRT